MSFEGRIRRITLETVYIQYRWIITEQGCDPAGMTDLMKLLLILTSVNTFVQSFVYIFINQTQVIVSIYWRSHSKAFISFVQINYIIIENNARGSICLSCNKLVNLTQTALCQLKLKPLSQDSKQHCPLSPRMLCV